MLGKPNILSVFPNSFNKFINTRVLLLDLLFILGVDKLKRNENRKKRIKLDIMHTVKPVEKRQNKDLT